MGYAESLTKVATSSKFLDTEGTEFATKTEAAESQYLIDVEASFTDLVNLFYDETSPDPRPSTATLVAGLMANLSAIRDAVKR